ncbi:MAG TPA: cytochrome c3 family protein, partial [Phycisphaerae bacterium]|nr:cytochrome c3 family protein [Phycisphaerae bacterium]
HKSPLPHMIRPDAERNCLSCHKPKEIENDRHPPVRRVECLLCHAGHTSPLPHLLKPPAPPGKPQTQPAGAEADADADADTGEQP